MKQIIISAVATLALVSPALAQDVATGEKEFRKCKACHMIQDASGTDIVKGGGVGPNLWNVVGRKVAGQEGYAYGDGIKEAAEMNPDLVWTEEELAHYITNPNDWLEAKTNDPAAKTKMTFKLNKGQADVAAYLASVSPDAGAAAPAADAAAAPAAEGESAEAPATN
ncbi:c-type cytochrome [Paracoccus zhejiangensis]|uniref:Cytochrome C n=1 Tax=Paracoccus zhejiangensis TaxID=1077935 RepID=A0A2H5EX71_9RHOB|nr:cytochrome C [Paracoccus zhejiangensis]AUH63884.1 cytochrome C [Paracoccus zhejiangensis]